MRSQKVMRAGTGNKNLFFIWPYSDHWFSWYSVFTLGWTLSLSTHLNVVVNTIYPGQESWLALGLIKMCMHNNFKNYKCTRLLTAITSKVAPQWKYVVRVKYAALDIMLNHDKRQSGNGNHTYHFSP